jgi:hypothetical protein
MMNGEREQSNLNLLIDTLIERTEQGKLKWNRTTQEDTFHCAVRGEQTFEVSSNEQGSVQVLKVRDRDGNLAIKHTTSGDARMKELHEVARIDALGIADGVSKSLELLNTL